ncbi:hypothetical protein ACJX0J_028069, partial [Zea mays]
KCSGFLKESMLGGNYICFAFVEALFLMNFLCKLAAIQHFERVIDEKNIPSRSTSHHPHENLMEGLDAGTYKNMHVINGKISLSLLIAKNNRKNIILSVVLATNTGPNVLQFG